ncbi:MAG: hypothetical protein HY782_02860 [Chloroflexi bacterium]|nr:hypothetical protein [Chloroflexota bacterium]
MIQRLFKTRAIPLLLFLLVIPVLACGLLNTQTALITNAVLSKDVQGANLEPVGITDTYSSDQQKFNAVISVSNAPANTVVKAVWTAIDVGSVAAANTRIDQTEIKTEGTRNVHFTLSPDGPGWPAGTYQVDIYLNDKLDRTVKFSVAAAPTPTPRPATATLTLAPPTTTPRPATPQTGCPPFPTAVARPSGLIANVTTALGVKGDLKEPENPTLVFPPSATFHAVVAIQNAPPNTTFAAVWYALDVGGAADCNSEIDQTELTTDGSRNLDFSLTPTNRWPVGSYRVEIYVNDVLDRAVNFSVSASAAVPPTTAPIRPSATAFVPPPPPTATSTAGRPPIPAGQGGLMVVSRYGREINFTINNKLYKIVPNGTEYIFLPPGKYPYSANIPGIGSANDIIEIQLGAWFTQTFSD